ncbi:Slp family lipoprotein [Candidatus Nitrotoga fabula]|uniref:Starvation lipoprotein Slp paralog n=1 Tax=Candidatus Nitrotoga fabula TaxID=2182327 RepID=A0A916F9B9_9PROT|nr:Slp family lipoprotein [Candidatus Nitrotoga fabula]CAE6688036.1 Starvation lipoprotein Slp paralog [Candidatus Nitrotoga fabula]
MNFRTFVLIMLPIAVTGCSTVPNQLLVGTFAEVTPLAAQNQNLEGQRVRWGGTIVNTEPGKDETCFEVVSYPLGSSARPLETDATSGRFLACTPLFYDPVVYAKGREITVIGTIQGISTRKLGEYEYRYPQIKAETVYLWAQLSPYYYGPPYPYFNGYYGPYWYNPWNTWDGRYGWRWPYWY